MLFKYREIKCENAYDIWRDCEPLPDTLACLEQQAWRVKELPSK